MTNTYIQKRPFLARELRILLGEEKFDILKDYLENNKELVRQINRHIKNGGGRKSSYVVIYPNKQIANLFIAVFIFVTTEIIPTLNTPEIVQFNEFEFFRLTEKLDNRENLELNISLGCDYYFEVVWHTFLETFANDAEENRTYKPVNRRMLANLHNGNSTIIMTSVPIPFFEKVAQSVENFHILDLRNITTTPEEAVEME